MKEEKENNSDSNEQQPADNKSSDNMSSENKSSDNRDILERIPVVSSADELAAEAAGRSQGGKKLAVFALLLALLAAAIAAYLGWLQFQQQQTIAELQRLAEGHSSQSGALESSVQQSRKTLNRAIQGLDDDIDSLNGSLEDARQIVDSHSRRLLALTATTTDDWRLAEVEYLLRLANQRLLTSQDVSSALSLLRHSDQILLAMDDPRLFSVREALAADAAVLSALGKADVEGVFLQLSALSAQMAVLPVISIPEFSPAEAAGQHEAEASADEAETTISDKLSGIADSTWQSLKRWIVIQQRDASSIKPLLPPEQHYYVRANLRLLLSQAQIAVIDGRQSVYSDSLSTAEKWLRDYFPQDDASVEAVLSQIRSLQQFVLQTDMPDISRSLLAIKAFINEQHRLAAGIGKPGKKKSGDITSGETKPEEKNSGQQKASQAAERSTEADLAAGDEA